VARRDVDRTEVDYSPSRPIIRMRLAASRAGWPEGGL